MEGDCPMKHLTCQNSPLDSPTTRERSYPLDDVSSESLHSTTIGTFPHDRVVVESPLLTHANLVSEKIAVSTPFSKDPIIKSSSHRLGRRVEPVVCTPSIIKSGGSESTGNVDRTLPDVCSGQPPSTSPCIITSADAQSANNYRVEGCWSLKDCTRKPIALTPRRLKMKKREETVHLATSSVSENGSSFLHSSSTDMFDFTRGVLQSLLQKPLKAEESPKLDTLLQDLQMSQDPLPWDSEVVDVSSQSIENDNIRCDAYQQNAFQNMTLYLEEGGGVTSNQKSKDVSSASLAWHRSGSQKKLANSSDFSAEEDNNDSTCSSSISKNSSFDSQNENLSINGLSEEGADHHEYLEEHSEGADDSSNFSTCRPPLANTRVRKYRRVMRRAHHLFFQQREFHVKSKRKAIQILVNLLDRTEPDGVVPTAQQTFQMMTTQQNQSPSFLAQQQHSDCMIDLGAYQFTDRHNRRLLQNCDSNEFIPYKRHPSTYLQRDLTPRWPATTGGCSDTDNNDNNSPLSQTLFFSLDSLVVDSESVMSPRLSIGKQQTEIRKLQQSKFVDVRIPETSDSGIDTYFTMVELGRYLAVLMFVYGSEMIYDILAGVLTCPTMDYCMVSTEVALRRSYLVYEFITTCLGEGDCFFSSSCRPTSCFGTFYPQHDAGRAASNLIRNPMVRTNELGAWQLATTDPSHPTEIFDGWFLKKRSMMNLQRGGYDSSKNALDDFCMDEGTVDDRVIVRRHSSSTSSVSSSFEGSQGGDNDTRSTLSSLHGSLRVLAQMITTEFGLPAKKLLKMKAAASLSKKKASIGRHKNNGSDFGGHRNNVRRRRKHGAIDGDRVSSPGSPVCSLALPPSSKRSLRLLRQQQQQQQPSPQLSTLYHSECHILIDEDSIFEFPPASPPQCDIPSSVLTLHHHHPQQSVRRTRQQPYRIRYNREMLAHKLPATLLRCLLVHKDLLVSNLIRGLRSIAVRTDSKQGRGHSIHICRLLDMLFSLYEQEAFTVLLGQIDGIACLTQSIALPGVCDFLLRLFACGIPHAPVYISPSLVTHLQKMNWGKMIISALTPSGESNKYEWEMTRLLNSWRRSFILRMIKQLHLSQLYNLYSTELYIQSAHSLKQKFKKSLKDDHEGKKSLICFASHIEYIKDHISRLCSHFMETYSILGTDIIESLKAPRRSTILNLVDDYNLLNDRSSDHWISMSPRNVVRALPKQRVSSASNTTNSELWMTTTTTLNQFSSDLLVLDFLKIVFNFNETIESEDVFYDEDLRMEAPSFEANCYYDKTTSCYCCSDSVNTNARQFDTDSKDDETFESPSLSSLSYHFSYIANHKIGDASNLRHSKTRTTSVTSPLLLSHFAVWLSLSDSFRWTGLLALLSVLRSVTFQMVDSLKRSSSFEDLSEKSNKRLEFENPHESHYFKMCEQSAAAATTDSFNLSGLTNRENSSRNAAVLPSKSRRLDSDPPCLKERSVDDADATLLTTILHGVHSLSDFSIERTTEFWRSVELAGSLLSELEVPPLSYSSKKRNHHEDKIRSDRCSSTCSDTSKRKGNLPSFPFNSHYSSTFFETKRMPIKSYQERPSLLQSMRNSWLFKTKGCSQLTSQLNSLILLVARLSLIEFLSTPSKGSLVVVPPFPTKPTTPGEVTTTPSIMRHSEEFLDSSDFFPSTIGSQRAADFGGRPSPPSSFAITRVAPPPDFPKVTEFLIRLLDGAIKPQMFTIPPMFVDLPSHKDSLPHDLISVPWLYQSLLDESIIPEKVVEAATPPQYVELNPLFDLLRIIFGRRGFFIALFNALVRNVNVSHIAELLVACIQNMYPRRPLWRYCICYTPLLCAYLPIICHVFEQHLPPFSMDLDSICLNLLDVIKMTVELDPRRALPQIEDSTWQKLSSMFIYRRDSSILGARCYSIFHRVLEFGNSHLIFKATIQTQLIPNLLTALVQAKVDNEDTALSDDVFGSTLEFALLLNQICPMKKDFVYFDDTKEEDDHLETDDVDPLSSDTTLKERMLLPQQQLSLCPDTQLLKQPSNCFITNDLVTTTDFCPSATLTPSQTCASSHLIDKSIDKENHKPPPPSASYLLNFVDQTTKIIDGLADNTMRKEEEEVVQPSIDGCYLLPATADYCSRPEETRKLFRKYGCVDDADDWDSGIVSDEVVVGTSSIYDEEEKENHNEGHPHEPLLFEDTMELPTNSDVHEEHRQLIEWLERSKDWGVIQPYLVKEKLMRCSGVTVMASLEEMKKLREIRRHNERLLQMVQMSTKDASLDIKQTTEITNKNDQILSASVF